MSFSEEELMLLGLYLIVDNQKKKLRSKKKLWMKSWLRHRTSLSHINLINELRLSDPNEFRNYLRMDEDAYFNLLQLVTPFIEKQDTVMRPAISAHERLSATLRCLATGRTFEDMKYSCAFSKSSFSKIIPETCKAICTVLMNDYMKFPEKEGEWETIARDFENKWNFPHCLGAVDGKHIEIIPPPGSGSYYFNYKKFHSIVLMAIANANYEILYCDIGTNGRISDGGVIENTAFYQLLTGGLLHLPNERKVRNGNIILPYVFLGDDAFSMRPDLLKPFSHKEVRIDRKIFNLRLCRARRIIENVFGILVRRFQIFRSPINMKLTSAEVIVMATCVLHNYLRKKSSEYIPNDVLIYENPEVDVENFENPRLNIEANKQMSDLQKDLHRHCSIEAKAVREKFMKYFLEEGQLEWQWKKTESESISSNN